MNINEAIATLKSRKELRVNGEIITLVRARKPHECRECPEPIDSGEEYCLIEICSAGLRNIKFPDRAHIRCIEKYLRRSR